MKLVLKIISYIALIVLIVPPVLVYLQKMELDTCKHWMLVGTIGWFALAPFWMDRKAQ
jgi:predicted histidine transporter YuiF (NhaC family)